MKVKLKALKVRKPDLAPILSTEDMPANELTMLAVDMALKITLANKKVEEAKEIIKLAKANLVFMRLWQRLGKTEKDLEKYINE